MGIRTKMLNVISSRCIKRMIVKNNRFYTRDLMETQLKYDLELIFVKLFKHLYSNIK